MLLPAAIGVGAVLGTVLSLVPGLHVALVLALVVAAGLTSWLPPAAAAAFVAAAAGASLYAKRLGLVYHPSATTGSHASLDPALRLTRDGRACDAVELSLVGTDMAMLLALPVVVIVGLSASAGMNLPRFVDGLLGFAGIPLIVWWVWHTCKTSRVPALTGVGFVGSALFGYTTLNHPSLDPDHAIAPVLAGLFGFPLLLRVFAERAQAGLPAQHPLSDRIDVNTELGLLGAVIGGITGFFAGLGTSSLVSLAADQARNDEDYLLLASAGEASNDLMAVLLALSAGLSRSGEAVLITRIVPEPAAATAVGIVLALATGAFCGRTSLRRLQAPYQKFVETVPPTLSAGFVLLIGMIPIALAGQAGAPHLVTAFALTAAGTCFGVWCHGAKLPAQVPFGALAVPLVIQSTGLGPVIRSIVFGN